MDSPGAPPLDAPSPDPGLERSFYWGQLIMTGLYGVEMFMCMFSTYLILSLPPSARRGRTIYLIIGVLILALLTVTVITDAVFLEFMWIDHRDAPGGPLGYLAANSAIWWQTLGTATEQLVNYLGDGLLMYRCFVIYNNNRWVLVFPALLYLGSLSMGIMTLVQSSIPGSDFFAGETVNFGVPWAALSVTLNFTLTCLITARILIARRNARKYLQGNGMDVYTGLASILVESSLPFSFLGIVFAITYGKNLDQGPTFLFIWSAFAALSPQFIIFRVATGRAWTREIATNISRGDSMLFDTTRVNKTVESYQLHSTFVGDNDSKSHGLGSVNKLDV